jgi:hypothetical protein
VPAIPGLLEYRRDNKELYVRSDKTWNVIAQESKVFYWILYLAGNFVIVLLVEISE